MSFSSPFPLFLPPSQSATSAVGPADVTTKDVAPPNNSDLADEGENLEACRCGRCHNCLLYRNSVLAVVDSPNITFGFEIGKYVDNQLSDSRKIFRSGDDNGVLGNNATTHRDDRGTWERIHRREIMMILQRGFCGNHKFVVL